MGGESVQHWWFEALSSTNCRCQHVSQLSQASCWSIKAINHRVNSFAQWPAGETWMQHGLVCSWLVQVYWVDGAGPFLQADGRVPTKTDREHGLDNRGRKALQGCSDPEVVNYWLNHIYHKIWKLKIWLSPSLQTISPLTVKWSSITNLSNLV